MTSPPLLFWLQHLILSFCLRKILPGSPPHSSSAILSRAEKFAECTEALASMLNSKHAQEHPDTARCHIHKQAPAWHEEVYGMCHTSASRQLSASERCGGRKTQCDRLRSPTCNRKASLSQSTVAAEPTFFTTIPLQHLTPPPGTLQRSLQGQERLSSAKDRLRACGRTTRRAGSQPAADRPRPCGLTAPPPTRLRAQRGGCPAAAVPCRQRRPRRPSPGPRRAGAGVTRVPGLRHVPPRHPHVIAVLMYSSLPLLSCLPSDGPDLEAPSVIVGLDGTGLGDLTALAPSGPPGFSARGVLNGRQRWESLTALAKRTSTSG